jgi:hypothetical protein
MEDFLGSGSYNWFFRAIDDSWFNLHNLHSYIQQLDSFVDADRHIVIKGHLSPTHWEGWGVTIMQVGAPVLMSRAAVRHMMRFLPEMCDLTPFLTDDNAMTFILRKTFPSTKEWADVRFAGPPITGELNGTLIADWDSAASLHFRRFNRSCRTPAKWWKPWATIVGCHTNGGIQQWKQAVEFAHANWIPENLMIEWHTGVGYGFCLATTQVKRELTSLESLRAQTPLIPLDDPRLNFSIMELAELAVAECPQWHEPVCGALRDRVQRFHLRTLGQHPNRYRNLLKLGGFATLLLVLLSRRSMVVSPIRAFMDWCRSS